MQHRPLTPIEPLLPELRAELERIRAARAFKVDDWLDKKVAMIADYLRTHGLKGAVLGLSGGIDSAVVLGILLEVKRRYPEVLEKVVPLLLPVNRDAVGQEEGFGRAVRLARHWDVKDYWANLHEAHLALRRALEWSMLSGEWSSSWASGQLVSYIRTPALYFTTSILTDQGIPSLVVGTTNRDEGAYLGYVGKASDGMVDLQVIADLHKSEVRQVAVKLGVTQEILDVAPTGDMYDGRVDEQVFGAPYDFVEMYLTHRCWATNGFMVGFQSDEAVEQYSRFADNLEALHRYNVHKYLVGSPAVHLNVLPSAVPGGWRE